MFRYYSVKQTLNTLTKGNPMLIAKLNSLVKVMSRVRMEGLFIFGLYLRWLFSKPDYSPDQEAHLNLNMFSDEFKKETKQGDKIPFQAERNWFNILRQCMAFSIGSTVPNTIPRSLWECLKHYRERRGEFQGYTPAIYEHHVSLHITNQVPFRLLVAEYLQV